MRQVPHPHEFYAFEYSRRLDAVLTSDGRWKMHLPHPYRHVLEEGHDSRRGKVTTKHIDWALFNLDADPCETTNAMDQYPDVMKRLRAHAEARRKEFDLK